MNAAEYLVIIVLAITLVWADRGFMREAIALLAGSAEFGWRGDTPNSWGPILARLLGHEPQRTWVGRAAIWAESSCLAWIVGGFLTYFIHQSGLSVMSDRILGGLFGALRGATLIALAAMLAHVVQLDEVRWWKNSALLPYGEPFRTGSRICRIAQGH